MREAKVLNSTDIEEVPLRFFDSDGNPVPGKAYDDADLEITYRRNDQASWSLPLTLASGTLGSPTSGSFVEDQDGLYALGLPTAAKAGGTLVTVRYHSTTSAFETGFAVFPIQGFDHQDETTPSEINTNAAQAASNTQS